MLSAVIITLNEERNIARCIDSLKDVAEDIVVVDSFSTDRTEEICREKGVRFIQHKWEGYSETKNFGNEQALYPLIISVDADEAISEELKKSVLEIKKNKAYDAYEMNRLTNYCGKWIKHCGWYPDRKLRIFDRDNARWEGTIHEKIIFKNPCSTGFLKGDLFHYSYYNLDDHKKQAGKFSDISAADLFRKGKKAGFFKIYGSPAFKFFRDYFLKLGFLDGYAGFTICRISANAAFLKYAKLRQMGRKGGI